MRQRLVGTGLPGPQGRGVGSQHCSFLLGGRIPQTPCGAGGSCALVGESTVRLCARCRRSGACFSPSLLGKVVSPVGRKRKGTVLTNRSLAWWERGYLVLREGWFLPALSFLLGGRIPQTPCGAGGSCALVGESTGRLFASCRSVGAWRLSFPPGEGGSRRLGESRKGRTVTHRSPRLVRRLAGTGLPGPHGRVGAPSTVLSCLGDVSPKPPAVREVRVLWSASARVVCVRAAAALGVALGD